MKSKYLVVILMLEVFITTVFTVVMVTTKGKSAPYLLPALLALLFNYISLFLLYFGVESNQIVLSLTYLLWKSIVLFSTLTLLILYLTLPSEATKSSLIVPLLIATTVIQFSVMTMTIVLIVQALHIILLKYQRIDNMRKDPSDGAAGGVQQESTVITGGGAMGGGNKSMSEGITQTKESWIRDMKEEQSSNDVDTCQCDDEDNNNKDYRKMMIRRSDTNVVVSPINLPPTTDEEAETTSSHSTKSLHRISPDPDQKHPQSQVEAGGESVTARVEDGSNLADATEETIQEALALIEQQQSLQEKL